MKFVALSDIHGMLPPIQEVPGCDILLIAGDVLPVLYKSPDSINLDYQSNWADNVFCDWLEKAKIQRADHIVGIAGNHDWLWEKHPEFAQELTWEYVSDSSVKIDNVTIWGSPYTTRFLDWAFNLPANDFAKKWDSIPEDVNILITHQPPYGYGDMVGHQSITGPDGTVYPGGNIGCSALLNRIKQLNQLKLHVFGHNHNGFGQWDIGNTVLANVSLLNDNYRRVNKPMLFEMEF